jgi:L-amino acid N-acyltransferase YncA
MGTGQVRVRPATPADLGAVAGIFAFYVSSSVATFEEDPPGEAQWRQRRDELAGRGLPFLVAEAGGTVAGYAYATPWRPKPAYRHTVEDSVYLDPAHRGQGLGAAAAGRAAGQVHGNRRAAGHRGHRGYRRPGLGGAAPGLRVHRRGAAEGGR